MSEPILKFNEVKLCPKCTYPVDGSVVKCLYGHAFLRVGTNKFAAITTMGDTFRFILQIGCARCDYAWLEETADKEPQGELSAKL